MARKLILTADDFGASSRVSEAIIRACREGVLRHASLLVAAEAAEEAVRRAKAECPQLSVGLHLALTHVPAVSPRSAELLAPGGSFPPDPAACGLRYFFRRGLASALEREMRAQFERFLSFGLPPSHVDGHAHIHVHPVIYPMLLRLAEEYGFRRVRLPGGELRRALSYGRGLTLRGAASQVAAACAFSALRRWLLARHPSGKVAVPDRTWGLLRSGLMDEDYLLHLLKGLPEGTTEIYLHPALSPDALPRGRRPTPTHRSRLELDALLSPRVKEAIRTEGIELI